MGICSNCSTLCGTLGRKRTAKCLTHPQVELLLTCDSQEPELWVGWASQQHLGEALAIGVGDFEKPCRCPNPADGYKRTKTGWFP